MHSHDHADAMDTLMSILLFIMVTSKWFLSAVAKLDPFSHLFCLMCSVLIVVAHYGAQNSSCFRDFYSIACL